MLDTFYDEHSQVRFARLEKLLQATDATAVIGAGASTTAGMPTWRDLYALFCKDVFGDDAPSCTEYSAELVTRRLQELRNQLGDDRALQLVKSSFDKPVAIVPDLYQLASEAFRRVATTNYDNFLMTLALRRELDPTIEIYPKVQVEARFFYLHGHAGTAENIHDVVLCEDEYQYAYDPENGLARIALWRLLQGGPCVFLGTSLEDPDFLRAIEQTETFRRREVKLRGGDTESYDPDPDWFLFKAVPQPSEICHILQFIPDQETRKEFEDRWIDDKISSETDRFLRRGIKPIWYVRDQGYSRLSVLLRRLAEIREASVKKLDEPVFLTQAEELESLGKVEQPAEAQQGRALELLHSLPEARRHFFQHATSPAWFEVLYDAGLMSLVPEPQQDSNGVVSIQPWDAAPYIMKLLKEKPESVAAVIGSVQTFNWHALRVLSTAMTDLPTDLLLPLIPSKVSEWLEMPYSHLGMVVSNSITVCNRLIDEGHYERAGQLIVALLQPTKGERTLMENTFAGYEAPDVLEAATRLSSVAPQLTIAAFQRLIHEAIATEYGGNEALIVYYWTTWRPAIEDNEITLLPDITLNLFVSGLRDAVKALNEHQPDAGQKLLEQYLASDQVILRRIGLHVVSLYPELIARLEEAVLPGEAIFDTAAFHENATLLQSHFDAFSANERARIFGLIATGPSTAQEEPEDGNRKSIWQWRLLSVLPANQLSAELQELRRSLQRRWGVPDPLTFLAFPQVTFTKPPASLEQVREFLTERGATGLLEVLRAPERHFRIGWDTDVSLGWQHVKTLAIESSSEMLSLAPLMTVEDLEIDGAWCYLDAYTELVRASKAFDWAPLLDLADTTVEKLDRQPDWDDANWLGTLARLLEAGMLSGNRIPDDQLLGVFRILRMLIERFASSIATGKVDDDLHILQLNSIAGIASDGLVQIAWRCLDETAPTEVRETLRNQLRSHLGEAMAGNWGGREAIFAIGRELPVLERLSTAWAEGAIQNIYSIDDVPSRRGAIQSFWSGYLSAPQVYNNVMRMLRERYGEVLRSLEGETDHRLDEELQNRLAEHIAIGWMRGLEGFGIEGLAGELAHSPSDSLLAYTAWYIGK